MLLSILIGVFLVLVFGIIGAVLIYKYFQERKEAAESQKWSSTIGLITNASMRRESSMESGNMLYYPEVEYEYEFLGISYTGHRITFGGSTGNSNRKKSEETLMQYPLGKSVTVYYDPNNPAEAVLERKMGLGGKVFLIVGGLFIFVSVCSLCIGGTIAVVALMGY